MGDDSCLYAAGLAARQAAEESQDCGANRKAPVTRAHRLTVIQAAKITLYQKPFKVQFAGASSALAADTSFNPSKLRNWPEPDAA